MSAVYREKCGRLQSVRLGGNFKCDRRRLGRARNSRADQAGFAAPAAPVATALTAFRLCNCYIYADVVFFPRLLFCLLYRLSATHESPRISGFSRPRRGVNGT